MLFKSLPEDLRIVVEFFLLTGISLEEFIHLKREHVDWTNNKLFISSGVSGSGSSRFIPLDSRIQAILKTASSQRPDSPWIFGDRSHQNWQLANLKERLQAAFEQCPLSPTATLPRLRHTFVERLLQKGVAFPLLYKMLGKTDIAKMMFYFGLTQRRGSL